MKLKIVGKVMEAEVVEEKGKRFIVTGETLDLIPSMCRPIGENEELKILIKAIASENDIQKALQLKIQKPGKVFNIKLKFVVPDEDSTPN